MHPVWTLFSRRSLSRLAYWLSALGYDLRDRSVSNYLYGIYFLIFWAAWVVSVLALLGSSLSNGLQFFPLPVDPGQATAFLGQYFTIGWLLLELLRVSLRSPFVLDDDDAFLLCQTPISRRKIAAALFLQGFASVFLITTAGILIVSFTLTEWRLEDTQLVPRLFAAIQTSLKAWVLILPVQMGLQSFLWGLGAVRLRTPQSPPWIKWIFPLSLIVFAASFLTPNLHAVLMDPLRIPFTAAFSTGITPAEWITALLPGVLMLTTGWVFLLIQSGRLNLSLAAQETRLSAAIQNAKSYQQLGTARTLTTRQKLVQAKPSHLLAGWQGGSALVSKSILQSRRTFRWTQILDWILLFGLTLTIAMPGKWIFRMVMGAFWTIRSGEQISLRFRRDLSRWWLLQSLPVSAARLVLMEMAPAWSLCVFAGWLALPFSGLSAAAALGAALLWPFLAATAGLATGAEILRRVEARVLTSAGLEEENIPSIGIGGVLRGLISVLIPLGFYLWAFTTRMGWLWGIAALALAALATWVNFQDILSVYRRME
jgi:hypothetical protein